MKLATATEVLQTMGIVSNPGSLANADQSLELSYSIVEGLLETEFPTKGLTDYFDTIGGGLCFRTTNRFLDIASVVVRVSTTSDQLALPTDGDLLPSSAYSVNADIGVITLRDAPLTGYSQVSVAYTSGFAVSGTEADLLVCPQWLRDVAVAVAVHIQNTFISSPANRKATSVAAISNEIRTISSMLLNSHKRPRMSVIFPAASVVNG